LFTLIARLAGSSKEKGPALRRGPFVTPELPKLLVVLTRLTALLLTGLLALALRILLLLAGLLATALLAGVLALLARLLVLLVRHFGKLPCWTSVGK
jgi:hypothetical protein